MMLIFFSFTNVFPQRSMVNHCLYFPHSSVGKESACNAGDLGSIPGLGRSPGLGRRKWQPTPVFLPGGSHGQRGLAVYNPWNHKSLT